jgi:hypothetical protein
MKLAGFFLCGGNTMTRKTMTREEFEANLNRTYNGAVKAKGKYLNERATLLFYCEKCNVQFYNKPSFMLGKDHQKHLCSMPYSDRSGERTFHVSRKQNPRKKKTEDIGGKITKMILEDYTYQQIAKELQVNPTIIKDHFKKEGLI